VSDPSLRRLSPCCTFRGAVVALDVRNGKAIWLAYPIPQEPVLMGRRRDGGDAARHELRVLAGERCARGRATCCSPTAWTEVRT